MLRFGDEGRYNEEFQKNICVVCPKCSHQATVISDDPRRPAESAKVVCGSCGFNESYIDQSWYGPVFGMVRRNCYQCGRSLEKKIAGPKHSYEHKLTCTGCKCEMVEKIQWYKEPNVKARDPFFGIKLWFVSNIKGNEFWAYNREHLSFINDYVTAKIRKREPNRNSSLVSRLPDWLLSAKNRSAVANEIGKMLNGKSR